MKPRYPKILASLFVSMMFALLSFAQQAPKYHVVEHFTLGGDGGWDYVTYDAGANRLFIARSTRVMVVDAGSGKLIGEIPDTPGVHGVALVPDAGRGFISAGRSGQVIAFELQSLKKVGEIKVGDNPDAIIYDPASKRVISMNGRSKDLAFIDPGKMTVVGTVPVGGKPEAAVADGKGLVYVNIEDKGEIVAIDSQKMSIVARWPLAGCEEPSGLALDSANQRLFSVCGNSTEIISDATGHKALKSLPIGGGADGVVFDPVLKASLSSDGAGTITVIQQKSADDYAVAQTLPTARSARTIALDPKTHRVFLLAAKFGEAPAATAEQPRPRPPVVPGSFEVIVAEPAK